MSMATPERAALRIPARRFTHGPAPWLLVRVSTTRAPARRRSARRYIATVKVNRASVYPPAVCVPVVSHVSGSRPFQISRSM